MFGNQHNTSSLENMKQGHGSSTISNTASSDVFNNLSNQPRCSDENSLVGISHLSMAELQKELLDTKDKLKIVT